MLHITLCIVYCPQYTAAIYTMENRHIPEKALVVAMVISMLFWGLGWPSGKILTHYCSPINIAVYRYIIVIATLLPILLFLKVDFKVKRHGISTILLSGILLAVYSYFYFKGLKKGAPGAGGVLVTTLNPIIAYFIGIFLRRKLPQKNEIIGLVLGLVAGSLLLKIWSDPREIMHSGNLYFLLSALTWAVMSKLTAKGADYGSPLSFTLWQYLFTFLCLLPLADMHEFAAVIQIHDNLFWGNLFFSSALVTSMATTVFFYATTRLGAEKTSSFMFMVPLAAALSSWLFLGEKIQFHTALGGLLGIVAVYTINRKKIL
jgi:drug/metabolite transporter (DMT)-like permease